MIQVTEKSKCCGCKACGDACESNAISFNTDIEGFWYPVIDADKCADCGLCEKVCPVNNIKELKKNDLPQPICFAAEHKNLEVVFDSTAGGVFSALADIMYKDKGYVGGAIFNKDFSVRQYISADKRDILKIRGFKFLQSDFEGFYKQVQDLIGGGEHILVCGSPCQMAALRAFLKKDYDNLIIVDYVCCGVNSPKVWRKYLDSVEEHYGSKVIYSKSASKEYGWRSLTHKVILANGRHCYETKEQSNFIKGYLRTGVYCRPSCYDCQFKGYPRMADITLSSFWGIENVDKYMEKNLGTSLAMINTAKGEAFFERVKARINYVQVPFNSIEAGNRPLHLSVCPPKVDRKQFFEDLDKMSFVQLVDKYMRPSRGGMREKVKRLTSHVKYVRRIFGATRLNCKAMYQLFKYNTVSEILRGDILLPTPHCVIDIARGAKVTKKGVTVLGNKMRFRKSKLETRLLVAKNGTLVLGPGTSIAYGADIEVFSGAYLKFNDDCAANIGLTVICGDHIEMGDGVKIGRNVTIRDNNGAHYMNRQGYRNSKPVIIGRKVWLCESCTIMNGVNIGDGAIVGAKSFVIRNVPAHTMVSGHPAEVVDEDILWKY